MGREWQIGDPVDGTTDGWMDAQNWDHGNDDDEDEPQATSRDLKNKKANEYSNKAWTLYMEFKDAEALNYIDLALNLDNNNPEIWNKKAIILESLKRYEESEFCYNKSLKISPGNIVYDNKARMLYCWTTELIEYSKKLSDGTVKLIEAESKAKSAINAINDNSKEDLEKYLQLMDQVKFYQKYENNYQKKLETIKQYPKNELFTITGTKFYKKTVNLTQNLPLKLVKEKNNEKDRDAIAVYVQNEKIGYVANSGYTHFDMTSLASELQSEIEDTAQGEYLFYLDRYAKIQFHIGRIIRD